MHSKGIKANAKVTVPYKISKKNLNKIKKALKSAGKKVVIKRKDIVIPYKIGKQKMQADDSVCIFCIRCSRIQWKFFWF